MKTKFYLMIAALTMLSFFSCKKDSATVKQAELDFADDDAVTEAVYGDVFNTEDLASILIEQIAKSGNSKSGVIADSCPSISVTNPDAGVWPKVITIDYGTECTGFLGTVRSGKILIEVTGPRMEMGSMRTLTFDNYYFNSIKVEGTKVVENMGFNSSNNLVVSVSLTGGKLILPDGKFIERSFQHEREFIAGLTTLNLWDDECLITGSATGKNIDGVSYTNTITTALHWTRICFFLVGGVVDIERDGAAPITLDYGKGDCDAKAVVTSEGQSKTIMLRYKIRTMGM